MTRLQAVYYRAPDASEPVADFIERLSAKKQAALDNQIDRLNMLTSSNPHLPFPYSSQVDGELRELRCHFGPELYRVLYRRSRNLIVLLHMFRKDTGKIPQRDIDVPLVADVVEPADLRAVAGHDPVVYGCLRCGGVRHIRHIRHIRAQTRAGMPL